jgi:S-DNA-T family DNA segregation ATPase FtsK/SpoIIIE
MGGAGRGHAPHAGRAGRPAGKPIVTAATLPATVQAPDQDVITRALGSLGIAGIDRWLRDGRPLVFPSPVREDGPGWRAEVDQPFGAKMAKESERDIKANHRAFGKEAAKAERRSGKGK